MRSRQKYFVTLGLVIVVFLSTMMPWIQTFYDAKEHVVVPYRVGWFEVILTGLSLGAIVLPMVLSGSSSRGVRAIATTLSLASLALLAVLIVGMEVLGGLIPHVFLTGHLRMLYVAAGAGPGIWVAMAALGVSVVVGRPRILSRGAPEMVKQMGRLRRLDVRTGVLVLGIVGFIVARFSPLFELSSEGYRVAPPTWLTPWIGGLSMEGVVILVVALLGIKRFPIIMNLMVAGVSWLFLAGCLVAAAFTATFGRVVAGRLYGLSSGTTHVGLSVGFWLFLVSSLFGIGGSLWALAISPESQDPRSVIDDTPTSPEEAF
jgi:hypothetical protein